MPLLLAAKSKMLVLLKQHAIALVAVFIALGGTSYAVTNNGGGGNSARGPLFACVTQEFNTLNLTTRSAGCPAGEYMISWNKAGKRGVRGIRGRRGPRGAIGPAGPKGATGVAGMVGATGPAGPTGANGIPGPRGQIGPQGIQGPADGPADGDLTGNYPDPVVAAGAITAAKVAANTLTGDQIDESTLAKVPSAAATDSIIPAITDETTFRNVGPNLTASVVVTCPDDGLAIRGSETSLGVTINSRTYDRHSYTVNATASNDDGGHYVRANLICIG